MSTVSPSNEYGLMIRPEDPLEGLQGAPPWKPLDLFFWFASGMTAARFSGRDDIDDIGSWVSVLEGSDILPVASRLVVWRRRRGVVEWKRLAFLKWLELNPFSMLAPDSLLFPVSGDLRAGVELHPLLKQSMIVDESALPDEGLSASPAGLLSTMVPSVRAGVSFLIGTLQAALARLLWVKSGLRQFNQETAVGDLVASLLGYFRVNLRPTPPAAVGDFTTSIVSPISRELARAGLQALIAVLGGDPSKRRQLRADDLEWIEGYLRRACSGSEGSFSCAIPRNLLGRVTEIEKERILRKGWIKESIARAAERAAQLSEVGAGDVGVVVEFSEQMNLVDLLILNWAFKESLREIVAVFTPLSLLTSFPHLFQSANYRGIRGDGRELRLGVGPIGITCILSSGTDRWIHERALRWAIRRLRERGYSKVVYWPNGSTLQVAVGRIVAGREGASIIPPAAALGRES